MTISKNRKRIDCKDYFNNIEKLINIIEKEYTFIKTEKNLDKIEKIYNKLLYDDGNVLFHRIGCWLSTKFSFKGHSIFKKEDWIERGFSEEEFNNYNLERVKKISDNNLLLGERNKKLAYEYDNKTINYKYNKYLFESINRPKCNLCNSELIIRKTTLNKELYYEIEKCSKINCDSERNSSKIKRKAFLPNSLYEEISDKISKSAKENGNLSIIN